MFADFSVAEVLSVALAGGGFPIERMLFRTPIDIVYRVVPESVFSVCFLLVRMSPVSDYALYIFLFQQV